MTTHTLDNLHPKQLQALRAGGLLVLPMDQQPVSEVKWIAELCVLCHRSPVGAIHTRPPYAVGDVLVFRRAGHWEDCDGTDCYNSCPVEIEPIHYTVTRIQPERVQDELHRSLLWNYRGCDEANRQRDEFVADFDAIHGPGSYEANPWCWFNWLEEKP